MCRRLWAVSLTRTRVPGVLQVVAGCCRHRDKAQCQAQNRPAFQHQAGWSRQRPRPRSALGKASCRGAPVPRGGDGYRKEGGGRLETFRAIGQGCSVPAGDPRNRVKEFWWAVLSDSAHGRSWLRLRSNRAQQTPGVSKRIGAEDEPGPSPWIALV